MKGFFHSRRFRQGTVATAIAVVVTALVVVLNFIATTLTERYSLTLDLTPSGLFSITDETKAYLADLEKDVTIYVLEKEETFSGRSEYYLQTAEVLKKYALESEHITLEFVDYIADPTFAQRYPTLQLSSGAILIDCGGKTRDLTPYDLYDIQTDVYGQGMITGSKAEQVLTSAILAVTSESTVNVAVITGHNEEPVSAFTSLLASNNYLTEEVNLATSEIASVYSVAVIAAPQRDFTEDELRRLDTFLENDGEYGKTLLFFASSQQTETPALNAFLADWGIEVRSGFVYESDSSRYVPGDPYMAILDYSEEAYSAASVASGLVPIAAYARPLSPAFESSGKVTTQTLLTFAGSAGIVDGDEISEPSGEIPHIIMAQSTSYDGSETLHSQVIVCGSSAFIDSTFLSNPNFANSEYMLSLLASLTGQEEGIFIQSKELGGAALDITAFQAILLAAILVVIFPLAVLITGLVIWARRRHL